MKSWQVGSRFNHETGVITVAYLECQVTQDSPYTLAAIARHCLPSCVKTRHNNELKYISLNKVNLTPNLFFILLL